MSLSFSTGMTLVFTASDDDVLDGVCYGDLDLKEVGLVGEEIEDKVSFILRPVEEEIILDVGDEYDVYWLIDIGSVMFSLDDKIIWFNEESGGLLDDGDDV